MKKEIHTYYNYQFKHTAVSVANHPYIQTQDVAEALDIHPFMLSRWKKQMRDGELEDNGQEARSITELLEARKKIKALEKELGRVRDENAVLKKGREAFSWKKVNIFRFIHENKDRCFITTLCSKLGVTTGGYYAWLKREKCPRQVENDALLIEIKRIHVESRETYGYPRVHAALKQQGFICGKHRVARLMQENGIMGKKAKRFKMHKHRHHLAQNSKNLLLNRAPVTSKNEVWVGDITFIKVNKEWSYLSVVMDLHTRKILGWTFEKKRSADMVSESLIMAANDNRYTSSTIFHSDQGSEYASRKYIKELKDRNIQISMSRKGHCWDNAYMESFFHSLKTEMIYFNHFKTLEEATAYIIDYIYFYNHERLHSSLNYQTPVDYERIAA